MFAAGRLRRGEVAVGVGTLVLLVASFLPWYGLNPSFAPRYSSAGFDAGSHDLWTTLTVTRWWFAAVLLLGGALTAAQLGCRAPALPISLSTLLVPFALVLAVVLIDRVFISIPGGSAQVNLRIGAPIGVVGALVVLAGAVLSLREDGTRLEDGPPQIETFSRGPGAAGA